MGYRRHEVCTLDPIGLFPFSSHIRMPKDESLLTWVEGREKKFLLNLPFCDQFILNICSV